MAEETRTHYHHEFQMPKTSLINYFFEIKKGKQQQQQTKKQKSLKHNKTTQNCEKHHLDF